MRTRMRCKHEKYRAEKKSLQILLSRTQAGPGRKVKQEQEEISRNHVQTFIYLSVECLTKFGTMGEKGSQDI